MTHLWFKRTEKAEKPKGYCRKCGCPMAEPETLCAKCTIIADLTAKLADAKTAIQAESWRADAGEERAAKLQCELDAVMYLAVDKWLDDDPDAAMENRATRAGHAREVALKAIEAESLRADLSDAEAARLREALESRVVHRYPSTENAFGEWISDAYTQCELCRARTTGLKLEHKADCPLSSSPHAAEWIAERDRLQKIVNDVDDVLVVCHLCAKNDDYKKALAEMVAWEISVHEYFEIEKLKAALAASELARREAVDFIIRAFTAGYRHGHEDTVEGGYTHVLPQDEADYFADIVRELFPAALAQPAAQVQAVEEGWTGKPCPTCNGTGYQRDDSCPACGGTGDEYGPIAQPEPAEAREEGK